MMYALKPASYFKLTSLIFLVIAGVHVYRAINDLSVSLGSWDVPMWLSWIGIVVALFLAYSGYQNSQK